MSLADQFHAHGLALFAERRFEEALESFRKALAEACSSEFWNDWASTQFVLGREDEAEAGFRVALDEDPTNSEAGANLEALLSSLGRLSQDVRPSTDGRPILEGLSA